MAAPMGQGEIENIVVCVWPALRPLQGGLQVWYNLSSENVCRAKEGSVSSKMGKRAVSDAWEDAGMYFADQVEVHSVNGSRL